MPRPRPDTFPIRTGPNADALVDVSVIEYISIKGVKGFALHRDHESPDWVVSHIRTGGRVSIHPQRDTCKMLAYNRWPTAAGVLRSIERTTKELEQTFGITLQESESTSIHGNTKSKPQSTTEKRLIGDAQQNATA